MFSSFTFLGKLLCVVLRLANLQVIFATCPVVISHHRNVYVILGWVQSTPSKIALGKSFPSFNSNLLLPQPSLLFSLLFVSNNHTFSGASGKS